MRSYAVAVRFRNTTILRVQNAAEENINGGVFFSPVVLFFGRENNDKKNNF